MKLPVRLSAQALASTQTGWLRQSHLLLHIGLHKTGTTYLQQQIGTARGDLQEEGLLFPTTCFGLGVSTGPRVGKMAGHIHFGNLFRYNDWMKAALTLSLLAREARSAKCRRILISVENASYVRYPDQNPLSRYILDRFGSVDVIVYLRRWDRWIESLYKERLEAGETRDFPTFLKEEAWLLDFPARLSEWQKLCSGNVRLRVFDYEQARKEKGLLRHFFKEVLGDMPPPAERRSIQANPSFNTAQAEALRQFNLAQEGVPRRREKLDFLLDSPEFLSLEGQDGFFDERERQQFLAGFANQNLWIVNRFGIELLAPQGPRREAGSVSASGGQSEPASLIA